MILRETLDEGHRTSLKAATMSHNSTLSEEIFSFHLAKVPFYKLPSFFLRSMHEKNLPGPKASESFFTMNLGEPIMSVPRYNFKTVALFAWWDQESALSNFLDRPGNEFLRDGWHVRMKLYRRWGEVAELKNAVVTPELASPNRPVVAVTLARLNILETRRFITWGRPVESQVRDHQGINLALAAMRPFNTFSTFSIWKNESEMLNMVNGNHKLTDGDGHKLAMQERLRKDFHHEFTTMRFMPVKEFGAWNGKSNYTLTRSMDH